MNTPTQANATPRRKSRVRVGHTTVVVEGNDLREIIANARMRMCEELPLMWDIIHGLSDDRFEVNPVT